MDDSRDGLVYSTEHGRMCPACSRPVADCSCHRPAPAAPGDGVVRVSRETKGRKGKGVTVVRGVPLERGELADLLRDLKQKCGCGGALRADAIEIQGDHRDLLVTELTRRGWTVKRAGG